MNAHAEKQESYNWAELARSCLDVADGDRRAAKERFLRELMADRLMLEAAMPVALDRFAECHLSWETKNRRNEDPVTMKVVPINGSIFNAAVRANFDRYMSRPAWGGKEVGNCTAVELRESAGRYVKQGASMIRESKWEYAVAEALEKQRKTAEATVADVLNEQSLAILWESTDVEF